MTGYEAKPAPLKLGAPMTKEEKEASQATNWESFAIPEIKVEYGELDHLAGSFIASD